MPELSIGLSYPASPFPSDDLVCFDSVLIAGPGYYDPPPGTAGAAR
ncbi:hypothetical protein [Sinosporangium siamense]|uniref:Uncharacterized protein n=1 Tax=Sinosporangium siamense TaxID=1367973 RepID=A0A919RS78_9ACTN|nr:hypothetical protein [Sinosporangium siamense]GII97586.1 hypothetical protein Ssi02_78170 [Sinosporangium siamense]